MARKNSPLAFREYPPDYINLVVDMYEHRHTMPDIIDTMNNIYPNLKPLTNGTISRIIKAARGDTIEINEGKDAGEVFDIRFDSDIAEFLRSLPYSPSVFVNAIVGIYYREYKLKKEQEQNNENNNNDVTRFG